MRYMVMILFSIYESRAQAIHRNRYLSVDRIAYDIGNRIDEYCRRRHQHHQHWISSLSFIGFFMFLDDFCECATHTKTPNAIDIEGASFVVRNLLLINGFRERKW